MHPSWRWRWRSPARAGSSGSPLQPIFAAEAETEGLKPYVLVRGRLEALVARPIFYDLVALGAVERQDGVDWFGVWSGARFWSMARAEEIDMGAGHGSS